MYKQLKFGRKFLLIVLQNHRNTKVTAPPLEQVRAYQDVIGSKYSAVYEYYEALDGLKLMIELSGNECVQNQFLKRWTHNHYVRFLFLFCPNGKICMCILNAPGTFHDSYMADYGIY